MIYIGIDVGGTTIKAGAVDETGRILLKKACPTEPERGYEAVIADMTELAQKVVLESGYTLHDVHSVGIGIPGLQDPATGRVTLCANLHWRDVPLLSMVQAALHKPVYVENDATVAGLAESVAGVSAGIANSVFVTLGTGVGGGIILNGKAYSGVHGAGSEIGHMITCQNGISCTCGQRGCWERYASATAIIRMGREAALTHPESALSTAVDGQLDQLNAKIIIDAAKAGDPVAMEVFDAYVHAVCTGLVNIINLYDPEIIVLGGGVSNAGAFLIDAVRSTLSTMVFCKTLPYARIEQAMLGNDAGIVGAAMLGR